MKRFLIAILLGTIMLTGCSSEKDSSGLKTGPTVTPMPEKATEEEASPEFDFTSEEVDKTIRSAIEEYQKLDNEYSFEITDDMTSEMSKHDDGYSEVYVYDKSDLMLAVLMYDDEKHLYRAELTEYDNGVVTRGTTYEDGVLSGYYVTAEGNDSFRVELKILENGYEVSYVDDKGAQRIEYNNEFEPTE